jgi:RNA 2',3'-cyclic 3'-phosphodiesterase
MKRLFVAIRINPDKEFLDQIRKLKSGLQHERIKWVEEHNIHITLKFFGDTEEKMIPGISGILRNIAMETQPFSLLLKQLGVFGSTYDPRVVWVGIEPYQDLVNLMKRIQAELKSLGFEPDRQNTVPHLTLGRIKMLKDKKLFQEIIDKYRAISSRELKCDSFVLYESILKKEGPVYKALEVFPLVNDERRE